MIFGNNEVSIRNETGFELKYRAEDALQLVDKTSESNKHIKVAYAKEWGKKRLENRFNCWIEWLVGSFHLITAYTSSQNHENIKDVIKPYDWTYTTSYQGTSDNEFIHTEKDIDIERLKRLDPILYYDENILFEDELADNGTATLTTRLVSATECIDVFCAGSRLYPIFVSFFFFNILQ